MYISKSNRGSQGSGLKILSKPRELTSSFITNSDDIIVQRYVSRPLLLDDKKHDLRLYVLIASVDPFIAFINEEGLTRFCVDEYEKPDTKNKHKENMHLTNYSLNKNSEKFVYTEELTKANNGTKRTLTSYWNCLKEVGHDPKQVKNRVKFNER